MFRIIAAVLFIIGAVIIAADTGTVTDPFFWLLSGLAAYALAGSQFERKV